MLTEFILLMSIKHCEQTISQKSKANIMLIQTLKKFVLF